MVLSNIHESIRHYDEKAASLFTATGIIFGLSSFLIEFLSQKTNEAQIIAIIVLGLLYLFVFLVILVCFCLIVFPRRKRNRNNELDYQLYSEDIYRMSKKDFFDDFISSKPTKEALIDQIKICSCIAHKKEILLRFLASLEVILGVLLASLMILAFI